MADRGVLEKMKNKLLLCLVAMFLTLGTCTTALASVGVAGRIGCEFFGTCSAYPSATALSRCRIIVSNGAGEIAGVSRLNQFGYYGMVFENAPPVDNYHFGYVCPDGIRIQFSSQDWQFVDGTFNVVNGGIVE
jgi:hypothetical protein